MKTTVTQKDLDDEIQHATYTLLPDGRTTVCQITCKNGFTVNGYSSCVDPSNYNKGKGEAISFVNAREALWPFLAFRLADQLHAMKEG